MLLPSILLTVCFFILPALITAAMGFTSMDFRFRWDFIGLGNYFKMIGDFLLGRILLNTGVYVSGTLAIFNVTFGLILAILTTSIHERTGLFFRSLWLLPRFSPAVVYAAIWLWMLSPTENGLLNGLRMALGAEPISWISSYPWGVIILTNGSIGASMGMVIFSSAIKSISPDYLWAARVDGASWLQEIRYVVLPMIRWPLLFITAFQTLSLLTSYEYILLITRGGPFYASTTWALHAYKLAFDVYAGTYAFGYGAALATVLVLIGTVASIAYWRWFRFREMMEEPRIEVT
ncbi:TPA: sugar ABC transporter permease [Candidatus Bipolaricaulota bacterium]|nr:sugar ABC transporter permease [Candidatus Bipolaricaulota bacterium]